MHSEACTLARKRGEQVFVVRPRTPRETFDSFARDSTRREFVVIAKPWTDPPTLKECDVDLGVLLERGKRMTIYVPPNEALDVAETDCMKLMRARTNVTNGSCEVARVAYEEYERILPSLVKMKSRFRRAWYDCVEPDEDLQILDWKRVTDTDTAMHTSLYVMTYEVGTGHPLALESVKRTTKATLEYWASTPERNRLFRASVARFSATALFRTANGDEAKKRHALVILRGAITSFEEVLGRSARLTREAREVLDEFEREV